MTSIFALQAPVQLLSYCFCSYSIGLIVHITWQGFSGNEREVRDLSIPDPITYIHRFSDFMRQQIAIFYMAALGAGLVYYIAVSIYSHRALESQKSIADLIFEARRDQAAARSP